MEEKGKSVQDSIIGQFGVGFYSAFIVADFVEAISKTEGNPAHKWSSDGSGTFEIEEVDDNTF
jgi:HSP90 family molecular chaperone